jgi:hypothetical protein
MSEQPNKPINHAPEREGTRFDEIDDTRLDFRAYSDKKYDAQAIARTLRSVEKPAEPNPVHLAAAKLSYLNVVRDDAKRIEDRKFFSEDIAA